MKKSLLTNVALTLLSLAFCLQEALCLQGLAQSGRRTQNVPVEKPKPKEAERAPLPEGGKEADTKKTDIKKADAKEATPEEADADAIKLDATLVTVPVIASDRNGLYIPDMKAAEFTLYEDGVRQEITYFATVNEPFHVVLMIDTSASTQEKLYQIRRAAIAFVEQLQSADRVKVIAFDDTVRDMGAFTNDRDALRQAIEAISVGQGTHLYDAFHLAMQTLARVRRDRRAIVLFSDGVDNRSLQMTYEDNLRGIEESGIIVYPIRYDTRAETEALVRGQQTGGRLPNLGDIIKRPPLGGVPPTVPGTGNPLPVPPVIINRPPTTRYPNDPRTRNPNDPRQPNDPRSRYPNDPRQDPSDPRYDPSQDPNRSPFPNDPRSGRNDDMIGVMLDNMYRTADSYLNDLALKSGGKLHRADTLLSLPDAFAKIAAELRTQYALGYYPTNTTRDGKYRKIQVKSSRKNIAVRARPGYQAAGDEGMKKSGV